MTCLKIDLTLFPPKHRNTLHLRVFPVVQAEKSTLCIVFREEATAHLIRKNKFFGRKCLAFCPVIRLAPFLHTTEAVTVFGRLTLSVLLSVVARPSMFMFERHTLVGVPFYFLS